MKLTKMTEWYKIKIIYTKNRERDEVEYGNKKL